MKKTKRHTHQSWIDGLDLDLDSAWENDTLLIKLPVTSKNRPCMEDSRIVALPPGYDISQRLLWMPIWWQTAGRVCVMMLHSFLFWCSALYPCTVNGKANTFAHAAYMTCVVFIQVLPLSMLPSGKLETSWRLYSRLTPCSVHRYMRLRQFVMTFG